MVDLDESAKIAHKSNTSSPEQVNDFAFEKHVVQPHHSKMQKDGWAKYIPNFAFK